MTILTLAGWSSAPVKLTTARQVMRGAKKVHVSEKSRGRRAQPGEHQRVRIERERERAIERERVLKRQVPFIVEGQWQTKTRDTKEEKK